MTESDTTVLPTADEAGTAEPDAGFLAAGRHPVNVAHLVMGIAFTGLALVWLLHHGDVTDDDSLRWLLPVPWLVAGAVGLVAAAVASRRRHVSR